MYKKKENYNCLDRGHWVLIGAFSLHLVLGAMYLWGSINVYIASYLHLRDSSITLDNLFFTLPILLAMTSFFSSMGTFLLHYLKPKLILIIGGVFIFGGYLGSTYVANLYLFFLLFAFLPGMGIGTCYLVPVACGWQYYPKRKGLVSGIIIGGFGLSSFIFSFVVQALFNPHNRSVKDDKYGDHTYYYAQVANRAMSSMRWLILMWAVLFVLGVGLIRMPGKRLELNQNYQLFNEDTPVFNDEIDETNAAKIYNTPGLNGQPQIPSLRQALKTSRFWHLYIMLYGSMFYGLFLVNAFKSFGTKKINDDGFLTLVGGIGGAMNGLSRLAWASLMDYNGFKRIYGALLILQLLLSASIYFTSTSKLRIMYLVWVALSLACEGGHFSIFPTVSGQVFGVKMGPKVYAVLFTAIALSAITTAFLNQYLREEIGYFAFFMIGCGLTVVCFILLLFFNEKKALVLDQALRTQNQFKFKALEDDFNGGSKGGKL